MGRPTLPRPRGTGASWKGLALGILTPAFCPGFAIHLQSNLHLPPHTRVSVSPSVKWEAGHTDLQTPPGITFTLSLAKSSRSARQLDNFTVLFSGTLGNVQSRSHISAIFPWFGKGPVETSCDLPEIPAHLASGPRQSLSLFSPCLGMLRLLGSICWRWLWSRLRPRPPPLTSTSTERGQAS